MIPPPFGEPASEHEQDHYSELYFRKSPFNQKAVDPRTFLIVGRRGAGKTALAQYMSFQKQIPDALYILADQPDLYEDVLSHVSYNPSQVRATAIPTLARIWEYVLWCLIFHQTKSHSKAIAAACDDECTDVKPSNFIEVTIRRVHKFLEASEEPADHGISTLLSEETLRAAKIEVVSLAKKHPIIIVLDTMEQYDIRNEPLMNAISALIQAASKFNRDYSGSGIHLKLLMSGELFPHLAESRIQNTIKYAPSPLFLFWRSKDLLRLICWRFYNFLSNQKLLDPVSSSIDWSNPDDVMRKMWRPYFGENVKNGRGAVEDSFYYVLRHTQMRPRQLIFLCNSIAELAIDDSSFPRMKNSHIREGIRKAEGELAREIINSFGSMYSDLGYITDSLNGLPITFRGSELAQRAKRTKGAWGEQYYSHKDFFSVMAELGVVGKVSNIDERSGVIEATFEYMLDGRLRLDPEDTCAIHPMFYSRLKVQFDRHLRVVPFGSDPSFREDA